MTDETTRKAVSDAKSWHYTPTVPVKMVPVFDWPWKPVAALKFLLSWAFLGSTLMPYLLLSCLTWFYLQPALERCAELRWDWILEILARNYLLLIVIVGGLHLYLYTFKRQGDERRFDARGLVTDHRKFFTRDQVRDNMFWTLGSGVPLWTAYEVFFLWAYANNMLPFYLDWRAHPVLFIGTFVFIPFFSTLHFYFIHRLLHWRPLYRIAHSVHHRNDNLGPWSGFSMHPIEHIMYLSSVLLHVVLMSHPLHIIFHCQWNAIGANVTHAGFESLTFRGKPVFYLTSFFHQMHHRYYDCNYGNPFMPLDRLFGSFHDGTPEAWARIKQHRREKNAARVENV